MTKFEKGQHVRVEFDAVYYDEPNIRPDEFALVVLPGTDFTGNVLLLDRFRAPISAVRPAEAISIDATAIRIPGEAVNAAARQIHTSFEQASAIEQHDAREAAVDVLNAAAAQLIAAELDRIAFDLNRRSDNVVLGTERSTEKVAVLRETAERLSARSRALRGVR